MEKVGEGQVKRYGIFIKHSRDKPLANQLSEVVNQLVIRPYKLKQRKSKN